MATYTHFGKQPDVLKHLILCEVLRNEHPQVYVETNSACAFYPMPLHPKGCCLKPSNHLRSYRPRWRAAISGHTADSAPAAFRLHPNNYRCNPRSDRSSFPTPSAC